jgi:YD repeat-containing protein
MQYDVSGKVTAVTDEDRTARVSFTYDDRGFRLRKRNHETGLETWYIRDASGNVLATYEKRGEGSAAPKENDDIRQRAHWHVPPRLYENQGR